VRKEAPAQLPFVGFVVAFDGGRSWFSGQQPPRLEEHELSGDRHELGQLREIDRVPGEMLQVRIREVSKRHGQDVELPRLDEMEEQLQRSLEDRKVDLKCPVPDRNRGGFLDLLDRDRL